MDSVSGVPLGRGGRERGREERGVKQGTEWKEGEWEVEERENGR